MRKKKEQAAKKLYIIIAGAIAAGKTTLALNLARAIPNCFYLDKDDLGPMAEKIFEVGKETPYDRQSQFFRDYVRDVEYVVAEIMALRGLLFNDCVIVNTPYTGEIRQELFENGQSETLRELQEQVHARGGELMVIYIDIDRDTAKYRLLKRKEEDSAAATRTLKVYDDIDAFLDKQNLDLPQDATVINADHFYVFHAAHPEQYFQRLKRYLNIADNSVYNTEIAKERFMEAVEPKAQQR